MTTVKVIVYSKLKQQQQQQKVIVPVRKVSKSVFSVLPELIYSIFHF